MTPGPRRDLIGYGAVRPDPLWPGGARVALNFVINYEEGSEYSILDGDPASEAQLIEGQSTVPIGTRDLNSESIYEFGSRVGVWRLLRLFAEADMPFTLFGCALALKRNPDVVAAIASAVAAERADICCHGWRWVKHWLLEEGEERADIARAVETLTDLFGAPPLGWYCRTGPSVNTRRLLIEHGGFVYDSDSYNDELPYWDLTHGRPHLVVPYTADCNDSKFSNPAGFGTGNDFLAYLVDSLDGLRREGAERGAMMSVGLHCRLAGRPGRAEALRRFLAHARGCSDVWVCRRLDVARHWIARHPPPAAGASLIKEP